MLWPQPEAWGNFKLTDYLPGSALDTIDERVKALRVLALYRCAEAAGFMVQHVNPVLGWGILSGVCPWGMEGNCGQGLEGAGSPQVG